MSEDELNQDSAGESEQSDEQPVSSEQSQESEATEQSPEQSVEGTDQSADQSDEKPADESGQPAEQSEEQGAESNEPSEQVDEQAADGDRPADQSDDRPTDDTDKSAEQFDDTGGAPQTRAKKGDCSSWEKGSPMLFAKRLADHYIRNELGTEPAQVKSIWGFGSPAGTPMRNGGIVYTDGREIMVTLNYPDHVIARGSKPLPMGPRCIYEYDSTPSGELVFTKRSCDDGR